MKVCGEIVSSFGHLTKDYILSPFLIQIDFRSDNGFGLYIFDLRYEKMYSTPQTVKVKMRCKDDLIAGRKLSYALVVANKKYQKIVMGHDV